MNSAAISQTSKSPFAIGIADSFSCLTRAALLPSKRIAARAQLASTDGNAFSAGGSLHLAGVIACLLSSLCFVNPSNSADMKSAPKFFGEFEKKSPDLNSLGALDSVVTR